MEVSHAYRLLPGVRNERGGWDDDRSVGAEPQPYRRFLSVRYRTPNLIEAGCVVSSFGERRSLRYIQ